MSFFDCLEECSPPIISGNGSVRLCAEDIFFGQQVHNALQEALLREEESEEYPDLFSDDSRKQFLYRILRALALGGSCNQYDDIAGSYMETAKRLYKSLVSVCRGKSGGAEVISAVYQVHTLQNEAGWKLFPNPDHPNNFLYLVVDPMRRVVNVLYHAVASSW